MSNITVKSNTYSYIILRNYVIKPLNELQINISNFVLSELKSIKNLKDQGKLLLSAVDEVLVNNKIRELSVTEEGGSSPIVDTFTKNEILTLLNSKLNNTDNLNLSTLTLNVPLAVSSGGTGVNNMNALVDNIRVATNEANGLLSKVDKIKIDNLNNIQLIRLTQEGYNALIDELKNDSSILYIITD